MSKTVMVKKEKQDDESAKPRKRMTISISPETHKELSEMGRYGETMDEIIQRLLNKVKYG
jgi:hypothetical protein